MANWSALERQRRPEDDLMYCILFWVVFNWSGSYTLQSAVNVDGPYTNVTALAMGPYTNSLVSDPRRLFRPQAN